MISRRTLQPRGPSSPLRIITLGGLEEVGRNMMVVEYRHDIIIIDMGLRFHDEETPGVDYIIPNAAYLKGKEKNIRGIFITHGHYDHIGAIPYLIGKLGYPTIFATKLTRGIMIKRQEDFPNHGALKIETVEAGDRVKLGVFDVRFFHVNHNIPDSVGLAIRTPVGLVVHTCDFKFDFTPVTDKPADVRGLAQIGGEGVHLLLSDSTGAENPGHSMSEKSIMENLDELFRKSRGRIIAATFASLIGRIQQMIWLAEKYGRKVAIDGYSMRTNVEIARQLGYIKAKKHTFIDVRDVEKMAPEKVVLLCTGAQGEGSAVLMRIANREHRFVQIRKGDTVIFSSSVVPGNERSVQNLKDTLYREGAQVFHYKMMDVHAGGHAQVEDLKLMLSLIRPKFFAPIHGHYFMLKLHADIAMSLGVPEDCIAIGGNGKVIELTRKAITVKDEKIPSDYVLVDGLGVGDVGAVVLRERHMMAQDGMFVIIATLERKSGKLVRPPDVISRGFIYMRESRALLQQTRSRVVEIIEKHTKEGPINWAYLKDLLRNRIGQFLFSKTERRPMVLPVIIEV